MTATYKSWAASDVLAAADVMTYLMKQVNIKCTDTSDRPASPAEPWRAMLTSLDREETYDGSGWVRTGHWGTAGRTCARVRRAATQNIGSASTPTSISWDTEDQDTDGFLAAPSATLTIPTGCDGRYSVDGLLIWAAEPGTTSSNFFTWKITRGGVALYFAGSIDNPNTRNVSGSYYVACPGPSLDLAAGDTVELEVAQSSGAGINVTAYGWLFREDR